MDCTFYEPMYWGLDPVFSTKVKLNVREVLALKNYPGFQGKIEHHMKTQLAAIS